MWSNGDAIWQRLKRADQCGLGDIGCIIAMQKANVFQDSSTSAWNKKVRGSMSLAAFSIIKQVSW